MFELLSLAFLLTLFYAAYLDWQYRRVPKIVWLPIVLLGIPISYLEYYSIATADQALPILIVCILLYICGWKKVIGGADALAMIFLILFMHEYGIIVVSLACVFCLPFVLYGYLTYRENWKKYGIPFMIPLLMGYIVTALYFLL